MLSLAATAFSATSSQAPLLAIVSCLAYHALPTARVGRLFLTYTRSLGGALPDRIPEQWEGTALAALQADHP